jgi:SWIM zinc finger
MAPDELRRRRAIARALAHGGAAAVRRVRFGRYEVASASRPGTVHTVAVDARGAYRCSCPAGISGRACWHAAAVYVAKVEHAMQGKGRVTGPAAPAQGIEAPAAATNVVDIRTRLAA